MYEIDPYGIAERLAKLQRESRVREQTKNEMRKREPFAIGTKIAGAGFSIFGLVTFILIVNNREDYENIFRTGGAMAFSFLAYLFVQKLGMNSAAKILPSKPKKKTKLEETLSVFD